METVCRSRSFDDMVDALGDVQRRTLLLALLEHNPQDDTPAISAEADGKRASMEHLITMRHVHLPKLADYGFIEWDEESQDVTKGPNFDEIRPLLELLDDHEDELPPDLV